MPDFGNPFSGLKNDRPLTKEELIRVIRFFVAAEYEATQLYTQASESTDDERAKKVLKSISDEEIVHAGEFMKLLFTLDPNEAPLYQKGMQEVEELLKGKVSLANYIRARVLLAGYVWEEGEEDKTIKTLKYISPFTGKKFHVSP